MSVRPVLLGLYEKYFLPLQKLLLPSLQAFIVGLLPGLEEGSEIYDRWVSSRADCVGAAWGWEWPLRKKQGKVQKQSDAPWSSLLDQMLCSPGNR